MIAHEGVLQGKIKSLADPEAMQDMRMGNQRHFRACLHVLLLKFGNGSALESDHHYRFRSNSAYRCASPIDKC
jgi:hypothetical protein